MEEIKAIKELRKFVKNNYIDGHKWLYRLDMIVEFEDNTPFEYTIDLRYFEAEIKSLTQTLRDCTDKMNKVRFSELAIGVM